MKVVNTIKELNFELENARNRNEIVGFIPTMGALHLGHLELVKRSIEECDFTVVSIYVNPTQFNKSSDLEKYPRNVKRDIEMLNKKGCDLLFCPNDKEMYPDGFQILKIDLEGLDSEMEGEFRPGHFDGVITVVNRFFEIIRPNKSYFGEKDFQQFLVVKKMAENISDKTEIVPCEIEREKSGLAMSSRNRRLSTKQIQIAQCLYDVLKRCKIKMKDASPFECEKWAQNELKNVEDVSLEYFRIADQDSLMPVLQGVNENLRAFVAAEIGGVRLIDNMRL